MMLARKLIDMAVRITPVERRDWIEALRAELAHVPPARAAAFAAGGLAAALRLRLAYPPFVLGGARYGLAGAALIWSALHLRFAAPGLAADPELPVLLELATAIAFGLGGLATALAGLRATCWLAAPMLLALGVVYAAGAGTLMTQSPNQAYYRALAMEDLLALAAALLIAAAARAYGGRDRSTA